jgi:predicted nucleotidyltransferase
MTQQAKQNIYNETKNYLLPLFDGSLRKIILYGSYARNEEDEESDIDIMVLTDLDEDKIKKLGDKITDIMVELILKYGKLVSILILNKTHYYEWMDTLPFYKNVSKEGVVLFEE